MQRNTHLALDPALTGEMVSLFKGQATVRLRTTAAMAADAHGLVHGGFIFGAADHAAMLAVNHPNVVLGGASTRFVAPVRVGDEVLCTAVVQQSQGRKSEVDVTVKVGKTTVMTGSFVCFVLDEHVLAADEEDAS